MAANTPRGRGRPAEGSPHPIRIADDLWAQVEAAAAARRESGASWVRRAIRLVLEQERQRADPRISCHHGDPSPDGEAQCNRQ